MQLIKSKLAVALACLGLQAAAQASLLHPDIYADSATQLRWLKLSETADLSMTDIENGVGGWNRLFRFATQDEVSRLLAGMEFVETDFVPSWSTHVGTFVLKMGGSTSSGAAGTWFTDGNQGAMGQTYGMFVAAELTNGDNNFPLSPNCPQYTNCARSWISYFIADYDYRSPSVGNFLVQIPEPSTLPLLGISAAALLAAARRRKARSA